MENKYYTPELHEFHVGFECEMKNSSDPIHFDWEKCIFKNDFSNELNEDYCFEYLYTDLKDNNIRVKHLSREDIESLGWKLFKQGNVNFFTFRMFTNDDIQMHVSFGQPAKIGFSTREGEEFSGLKIKNKSELWKLMQQLNINSGGK